MKFLTLNTHSWMEEDAEGKFQTLKEQILKAQYDIICFQEVNQEIETAAVETDAYYHVLPSATSIHQDHFVRLLVEKLAEEGLNIIGRGLIITLVMTTLMKVLLSCHANH